MSSYKYEDYNSILEDAEDLYSHEDEQLSADTNDKYWDNYYHNITEELVDE